VVRANLNTVPVKSASTSVTFNFLFEVDPCYATLLLPQTAADLAHLIEPNHNPTQQSYPQFADSLQASGVDCGPRLYKVTGTPADEGWFSLLDEPDTLTMSMFPETGWTVGSYQMTLFVELANYPILTPEIGLEIPFTITVDSVCLNTQFYFGSPPKLLHQVGKEPVFARISAKDSVSIEGSDGHSFCGKRTFELGPAPYVWVDVDSPVGFSTTMYLNGTYDYFREQKATLRLGLEEYPSFVKQSFDFPVYIIDMCEDAEIVSLYSYEAGINYVLGNEG